MRCPLVRTVWPGQLPKSFVCQCSFGWRGHPKLRPTVQRRARTNIHRQKQIQKRPRTKIQIQKRIQKRAHEHTHTKQNKYRGARENTNTNTKTHTQKRRCSGRYQPSTRECSSTPLACHVPNVDYRAFATHVQNVFGSLRFFLDERTNPHRRGLELMLTTLRPQWSCAPAPLVLRTPTCPERRQVRCCGTQLHFAKLLLRRCQSERMMPDRNRFLYTTTPFFCPLPFVLLLLFAKAKILPPATNNDRIFLFVIFALSSFAIFLHFFIVRKIGLVGFL